MFVRNELGAAVTMPALYALFALACMFWAPTGEKHRPAGRIFAWVDAFLLLGAILGAAFLLFIVTTSNPFIRLDPAPFDGMGLNPVLQDPALAFHPPFLYAGYVGLSIAFFALADSNSAVQDPFEAVASSQSS